MENPIATIDFDSNVFALETVKCALYRFGDRYSFDIRLSEGSLITVSVYAARTPDDTPDILHLIKNAILDQDLRTRIADETKDIRTLILANCFSKTDLIDQLDT